jgi:carbon monoxide dehydrogenase subunit G
VSIHSTIATTVTGENANISRLNMKVAIEIGNVSVLFFPNIISKRAKEWEGTLLKK